MNTTEKAMRSLLSSSQGWCHDRKGNGRYLRRCACVSPSSTLMQVTPSCRSGRCPHPGSAAEPAPRWATWAWQPACGQVAAGRTHLTRPSLCARPGRAHMLGALCFLWQPSVRCERNTAAPARPNSLAHATRPGFSLLRAPLAAHTLRRSCLRRASPHMSSFLPLAACARPWSCVLSVRVWCGMEEVCFP